MLRFFFFLYLMTGLFACRPQSTTDKQSQASLGKIIFEVSGNEEAKPHFIRGVAALHNFWYPEAQEAFQKAIDADPDFAMAYWGLAMAHNSTLWQNQDKEAALKVLNQLGATSEERLLKAKTEKEKSYLKSLDFLYSQEENKLKRDNAYMQFMKDFYVSYPEDQEVAAFYALSLLGVLRPEQDDVKERMEAAAVSQKIIKQNGQHPGAVHYLIHALDDPLHAPMALEAAYTYAEIAPESNHALHMPSHIFVQLGLWREVINSNVDAFAASQKWVEKKGLDITELDYHSLSWMSYGYEQCGQFSKSFENLQQIKTNYAELAGKSMERYMPQMEASYIINGEYWQILPEPELEGLSGRILYTRCSQMLASGLSAVHLDDQQAANKALDYMALIRKMFVDRQDTYHAKLCEINEKALAGFIAYHQGEVSDSRSLFEQGLSLEESMEPPSGPPDVVKPIHELYGEVLLEMNMPQEAMNAFAHSLKLMPRRSASLLGMARAAELLNDGPTAFEYYSEFLSNWKDADPNQSEVPEAEQFLKLYPELADQATAYYPLPLNVPMDQRLSMNQCLPSGMKMN
ncbi:hypothetical protein PZB74_13615 [Porifericola rhodea]|uniref:hypothetical protein n=1 Tax=Porifericola rhodea TaxID=930972 RepID=UPI002665904A|nr:hypothetical protein [Porifericola rhodea]WKN30003.1 hypothetical protein PZB74_13615 [Porifericola rhodea]